MSYRKYRLGSYQEMCAAHRWEVPERYNIARDVCDKHSRDKLAMVWEDWRGNERRVAWGELQDLSCRFANALRAHGIEPGDRVATLLPSLPETAAVFLGTYRAGCILLSMSVLYGDEGITHRLRDSQAKAVVTDTANRHRIPEGMVPVVFVMDADEGERTADDLDFGAELERGSPSFETVDTSADDPAQLYYSSGTTGLAKGILHAHRAQLRGGLCSASLAGPRAVQHRGGRLRQALARQARDGVGGLARYRAPRQLGRASGPGGEGRKCPD